MAIHKERIKTLLVQSPPWGVTTPPLGVAYLTASLKRSGLSCDVLDLNLDIYNDPRINIRDKWDTKDFEYWASGKAVAELKAHLKDLARRIISFESRVIGFSATFASVPFLNALLPLIRDSAGKGTIIVIGGGGASYPQGRALFNNGLVDFFVIGEGELPLNSLVKKIENNEAIKSGPDFMVWKDDPDNGSLCLRAARAQDIDDISFPTLEEFNIDAYTQNDLLPIVFSRGCVKACVFCCDAPLKSPYRCRDPEKVSGEINFLVQKYKRRRLEFSDLLLNGNLIFLDKLCDCLIGMNLGVCWGGQATIRKDMDAGLYKKMKRAGCGGLTFGCESFSDNVLRLMHKGMTVEDAKNAFIRAKEAGMLVEVNLIVGFPGERDEDVDETIGFLKNNSRLIDRVNSLNICTIGPGMYIYDHLQEYNIDSAMFTDWYAWFNKDKTNTIETRVNRHKSVLYACVELGLVPAWQNVRKA